MKSAWKLLALGIVVSVVALGCSSADLGWHSRSSEPIAARPLREAPPVEETTAAPTSQPTADAGASDRPEVDAEVAPLAAQIQAFTGRVTAAEEARSAATRPALAETVTRSPASRPAGSEDQSPPGEGHADTVTGRRMPVRKVYVPTPPVPEPPDPSEPPATPVTPDETVAATPDLQTTTASAKAQDEAGRASSAPPSTAVPANSLNIEIVEVRPAAMAPATVDAAAIASSPNQPASSDVMVNGLDLKTIIAKLERDMEQRPPHPDDQIRLRLLYIAAGLPQKATGPIDGMDPVQGELLSAVLQTVASTRQAILEPTEANPTALTAAEELRRLLGQQAGVIIPRICLVTRVSSFGDYEAITPLRFKAGQPIQAYVYTEVANYHSEPTEDGRLRTLLAEKIEVFSHDGKSVWQRAESNIEDRVRTPRHDFFIPFPIRLPATLPAGEYVLKATIEDRIGGTTDQQRLTFSIYD